MLDQIEIARRDIERLRHRSLRHPRLAPRLAHRRSRKHPSLRHSNVTFFTNLHADLHLFELFHKFYRSEEHTSELQSLMRISYAVFCLKTKNNKHEKPHNYNIT